MIVAQLSKIEDKLDNARIDIAGLKIKSGVWGFIAGSLPAAVALILLAVKG